MDEIQQNDQKKSSYAFRTIGEVAVEMGLPTHVLRFWESKFGQIKPHKRRGGHRYYRPEDIEVIKEIKSLLYDRGFTIKGAQKYLKDKKKGVISEEIAADAPQPVAINAADSQVAFANKDNNTSAEKNQNINNKSESVIIRKILGELLEIRDSLMQSVQA